MHNFFQSLFLAKCTTYADQEVENPAFVIKLYKEEFFLRLVISIVLGGINKSNSQMII